ncbi:unnamed protein product [Protopolystoma xenopodis]|uniref:t-SNARE coiled-coil homology domain-containing protein n=1 Tax=Protopolystoma xenopodis TaxID=117903 RepID=A0A448WAS7_9PLAT|nr:unnamed protein product [Protopolystoma xenopodis]
MRYLDDYLTLWSHGKEKLDDFLKFLDQIDEKIRSRGSITNDAREDEMDKNLGVVSEMVGQLHSMAIDMNTEVEIQNSKLDQMAVKVCLLLCTPIPSAHP